MIAMRLSEAASPVGGTVVGADVEFRGVSTDTRSVRRGELFVALKGPRFDAHDLIDQAAARGAAAAMVDRDVPAGLSRLRVGNTRIALGDLAACWRRRFGLPVVAVTGSNGKTTVKEMLASILRRRGAVLATRGNLNNDIGLPLTVCRLGAEHRHAVVEMGANHPGEIAYLCTIAQPTVAAITLCAPAHLEGFGSIEGVARAKGEILYGLRGGGTAVLNADEDYIDLWRGMAAGHRIISFALSGRADVTVRIDADTAVDPAGSVFELITPHGWVSVHLPLPGRHNIMNALTAAACAHALDIEPDVIAAGLESVQAVHGRLEVGRGAAGCCVIDDTYNANPASLTAALAVLASYPGEHWLVLGDMGELGAAAAEHHRDAGAAARASGVDSLYTLGELSRGAVEEFGAGGRHFSDFGQLVQALKDDLHGDLTILVKGSRAMQMERVVRALAAG